MSVINNNIVDQDGEQIAITKALKSAFNKPIEGRLSSKNTEGSFDASSEISKGLKNIITRPVSRDKVVNPTSSPVAVPDYEERARMGVSLSEFKDNYQKDLVLNQSKTEQAGAMIERFFKGTVGGFVSATGASVDILSTTDMLKGSVKEYGNFLTDWGKEYMQQSVKDNPIYELDPGSFSPSQFSWWANQVGQQGYSMGIMLQAIAGAALQTVATEGLGIVPAIGNLAKTIRGIGTLSELLSVASNSAKIKNTIMLSAAIRGINEMHLEGLDSYNEVKNKYTGKINPDTGVNYTEDEITQLASVAASETARGNIPKVAMDMLQARLMLINPMTGAGEGAIENLLGKIPNAAGRVIAQQGAESLSEGLEEYYQYIVSEEGKHSADVLSGHVKDNTTLTDRFMKYQHDAELWNSFAGGMLGGALLGNTQKLFQKVMEGTESKKITAAQKSFVSGMNGYGMEMAKKIKELEGEGDLVKATAMKRVLGEDKALQSIHLDALKGTDTAYSSYMTFLNKALEAAKTGNVEQIKAELGADVDVDFIKQNFPVFIKDAERMKSLYNENAEIHSREAVVPITKRQYILQNLGEMMSKLPAEMAVARTEIPDYSNLSPVGRSIYEATLSQQAAANIGDKTLFEKYTSEILRLQEEEVPDKETAVRDTDILNAIPKNNKLLKLKMAEMQGHNQMEKTRKELATWTDPEFQKLKTSEKELHRINMAQDADELNAISGTLRASKTMTPELEKRIKIKREQLSINKEKENLKKGIDEKKAVISFTETEEDITDDPEAATKLFTKQERENAVAEEEMPVQKETTVETAAQVQEKEVKNPALKDVESTAKALEDVDKTDFEKIYKLIPNDYPLNVGEDGGVNKSISEAYHKAKADGSNPELVKAVEELLDNKGAVSKPVQRSASPSEVKKTTSKILEVSAEVNEVVEEKLPKDSVSSDVTNIEAQRIKLEKEKREKLTDLYEQEINEEDRKALDKIYNTGKIGDKIQIGEYIFTKTGKNEWSSSDDAGSFSYSTEEMGNVYFDIEYGKTKESVSFSFFSSIINLNSVESPQKEILSNPLVVKILKIEKEYDTKINSLGKSTVKKSPSVKNKKKVVETELNSVEEELVKKEKELQDKKQKSEDVVTETYLENKKAVREGLEMEFVEEENILADLKTGEKITLRSNLGKVQRDETMLDIQNQIKKEVSLLEEIIDCI